MPKESSRISVRAPQQKEREYPLSLTISEKIANALPRLTFSAAKHA